MKANARGSESLSCEWIIAEQLLKRSFVSHSYVHLRIQ